jgi:hypothetical protein
MFKNSGNINYIQKNKKIVLSLIGISFLTGAAVIDKVVSPQEISYANKLRADENLRISPHPVVPKDKLLQIKPKNEPMALLTDGWVPVGNISGYDVKYRKFAIGSDYMYQILGTSTSDGSQLGFGCICANINGTQTWKGAANSACGAANPNTPVILDNPIMGIYKIYNVPIPAGACCKSVPRVGTTNIPGLPPCG